MSARFDSFAELVADAPKPIAKLDREIAALQRAAGDFEPAERRAASGIEAAASQASDARRPLKVLVVDDIETNRAVIGAMLKKLGHEAHFAEDGAKAIEAARNGDYDAILMDIQMPNVDGLAATRAIRGFGERLKGVPIIAVSAFSLQADKDAAFRAGVSGFLSKPFRWSQLDQALRSLSGNSGFDQTAQ